MNHQKKYYLLSLFCFFTVASQANKETHQIDEPEKLGWFQYYKIIPRGTYIIKKGESGEGESRKTTIQTLDIKQKNVTNLSTGRNEMELQSISLDETYNIHSDQIETSETNTIFGATKLEITIADIATDIITGLDNYQCMLAAGCISITACLLIFMFEKDSKSK